MSEEQKTNPGDFPGEKTVNPNPDEASPKGNEEFKNEDDQNDDENNDSDQGVIKNDDGTVTINGKKYIDNESYEILAEKNRKAKIEREKLENQRQQEEEEEMKKKGKYEELAKKKDEELKRLRSEIEQKNKINSIQAKAMELGAIDLEAVVALVDLEQVKLSEDGSVDQATVDEILTGMKNVKGYLFDKEGKKNIGSGGGNPSNGSGKTFKRSQLQNHEFYKENEKDIIDALANGRIIDDIDS